MNKTEKILQVALLYFLSILHSPLTLIRFFVCLVLIVDEWCDKTINNWLDKTNKEIIEEEKTTQS